MATTTFYADRGYVFVNGIQVANLKSVKWTIDEAVSVVDTMTANKRSVGFKKGNRKVSGSFELEVEDKKPAVDLAFQYGNDVSVICQLGEGGDRYSLVGLQQTSQDMSGSVGDTSKSISFVALDAVNENGPTVNAPWGF